MALFKSSYIREDDSGSAAVEFVVVALPLFIPALIFFMSMTDSAKSQMDSLMIARQSLHAFLNADSDIQGQQRVAALIHEYQNIGGEKYLRLSYRIDCETLPCLSPHGLVRIAIKNGSDKEMVAQGHVDKWR